GQEYAGLFANDDKLVERLVAAGEETGERVWRMPLGPEYDKMIDSKFADMKNTGGRHGGANTPSQLLARVVRQTALGATGHRGHGARLAAVRHQQGLDLGLGRAASRPVGARPLRKLKSRCDDRVPVLPSSGAAGGTGASGAAGAFGGAGVASRRADIYRGA